MKINYPIKYAAMPIIEQVGWFHGMHELERKYDVVCYTLSKCYLISDLTNKNEKLCKNSLIYLHCSDDYAEKIRNKKDEFEAKLTEYKILEEQILIHTDDIKLGQNKQLNNILRISNNSSKILSCDLYQMLDIFSNEKFVVYTISQEHYDELTNLIIQEKIDDIKAIKGFAQWLLIHKTKDYFIKLAIEDGCGAHYLQNNSIKYDCTLDKVTKDDFENIDDDTLIFYTTETIENVLNSLPDIYMTI